MSLYKDASLVMIPSAYKDGKLYSIRPTDGSGDFTFSRGSNLAATRVDVNGLIEKGRENLVTYSNDFSNVAWSKIHSGGTTPILTSGFTDPNGGSNAWRLQCSMTGGLYAMIQQGLPSSSDVEVASIYIKSNTGADQDVYFRINNIDQTTTRTATTSWQRIEVYANVNGKSLSIGVRSAATGSTSSCDVLIYAAQAEKGLVATDYIETTTTSVSAGILEDMPRLDYSGGASCPSLLLEPQRANIIDQSEYFGAWTFGSGITLTHNHATSPEGLQNATLLARTTSGNIQQSKSVTSGNTYAISVFGKEGTSSIVQISATGVLNTSVTQFDLSDQSITTTTGSVVDSDIEDYGNGWYRCWITQTAASTGTGQVRINTGDNVNISLYGAQMEAGSYPTSYIPTYGTSQTRSEEYIYNTTTNFKTEGILGSTWTFMYDQTFVGVPRDAASSLFLISNVNAGDGLTNVRISLNSNGSFRLQDSDGTQISTGGDKILCRYDGSTIAWYIDGTLLDSHSVTDVDFANLDAYNPSQNNKKKVVLNQILIFPTALTDSECIALTSI